MQDYFNNNRKLVDILTNSDEILRDLWQRAPVCPLASTPAFSSTLPTYVRRYHHRAAERQTRSEVDAGGGLEGTSDFTGRRIVPGTIALQGHDPGSTVY